MYSIHEVCERTGLSAHTLRYYEKEKLLPNVRRSPGGFRQYTEEDMEALGMICCLKNTGMSLQDISRFMTLAREGDQTLRERCELLKKHRDTVLKRMEEMQRYLDKVTWKVNFFTEKLAEYERRKE
jgi:DNA-binding transcriptional MerR regulator